MSFGLNTIGSQLMRSGSAMFPPARSISNAHISKIFTNHVMSNFTEEKSMNEKASLAYARLCTEFYELDKPTAPKEALSYYLQKAKEAQGPILEPMCGTGRFLIPLVQQGYQVTGFDSSKHMLDLCNEKCRTNGLKAVIKQASFEDFQPSAHFKLVFIPTGSFCLLTEPQQVEQALETVVQSLDNKGRFILEIDTINSIDKPQEVWKGRWVDKPDGSKLVLNTFSSFDSGSRVNTILCRYELWEKNRIVNTEVEDFRVRLYELDELEKTLRYHGFKIVNKNVPYNLPMSQETETIIYECEK